MADNTMNFPGWYMACSGSLLVFVIEFYGYLFIVQGSMQMCQQLGFKSM